MDRVRAMPSVYGHFVHRVNTLGLGIERDRIALALLRTLEPLLVAEQTGGIERNWRELDEAELRRFVECGLQRELILLTRANSEIRAQLSNSTSQGKPPKLANGRPHVGHGGHGSG
ncbi:MAG TPA: hypothetical protein VN706_03050 [Gemmatimonadaceae bacterium]|nr:hypothetical protein [Gemmatimonadaceae bacterium]